MAETTTSSPLARGARDLALLIAGSALLLVPVLNLVPVGFVFARMGARARTGEATPPPIAPRALAGYLGLGLRGVAITALLLFLPGLLFGIAWIGGWIFSYDAVGNFGPGYYAMGFGLACTSALLLVPALGYLPAAQARFAATGRARAMLEVGEVMRIVRRRPWAWAFAALAWPPFMAVFAFERVLYKDIVGATIPGAIALNAVLLIAFAWLKGSWAGLYHRSSELPDPEGGRGARRGALAVLLAAALLGTLLRAVLLFIASFKLWDAFHDPLFMIPAVPYPGGAFGLGE